MSQFDLKNAVIKFKDGTTPTPLELTVKVGEGTLTWTEKKNRVYTKNRGRLDEVRDGDEEPVDVSFEITWEFLKAVAASGVPTPEDVLKNRGEAATWVSSDSDTCRPFAIDIEITYTPVCAGVDTEVILLTDFRYESLQQDTKAGKISCSGKCNVTEPTVTRV